MPTQPPTSQTTKRQRAHRFGVWSESIVAWYLRLHGYRILHRRYKTKVGEIDMIARRGKVLAMIEVKARGRHHPELLSTQQQQRISRAAMLFIAKHREFANLSVRFDMVEFVPWRQLKHVKGAWQPIY